MRTAAASIGLLLTSVSFCASPIGVFMQFEVSPSQSVLADMQREVERILDPLGLHFAWSLASQNKGTQLFDRVILLKFEGSCDATPARRLPPAVRITLGDTAVSGGSVMPYSTVHCLALRRLLFAEKPARTSRDGQMGRAMGRVVAHEFMHVLLRTRGHERRGVARASQEPRDLLGDLDPFYKEKPAGNLSASRGKQPAP